MTKAAQPPFEYLATASQTSLEGFEIARLNQIATFRKEIERAIADWVAAEADVRLARWILERRKSRNQDARCISDSDMSGDIDIPSCFVGPVFDAPCLPIPSPSSLALAEQPRNIPRKEDDRAPSAFRSLSSKRRAHGFNPAAARRENAHHDSEPVAITTNADQEDAAEQFPSPLAAVVRMCSSLEAKSCTTPCPPTKARKNSGSPPSKDSLPSGLTSSPLFRPFDMDLASRPTQFFAAAPEGSSCAGRGVVASEFPLALSRSRSLTTRVPYLEKSVRDSEFQRSRIAGLIPSSSDSPPSIRRSNAEPLEVDGPEGRFTFFAFNSYGELAFCVFRSPPNPRHETKMGFTDATFTISAALALCDAHMNGPPIRCGPPPQTSASVCTHLRRQSTHLLPSPESPRTRRLELTSRIQLTPRTRKHPSALCRH
jgi:hypothetical protein